MGSSLPAGEALCGSDQTMTVDSYRPPSEHGGRAPQPGARAATPPKGLTGPAAATHVLRPDELGTQHSVAAGHPLAALAAHRILEAGGNAVDAGRAPGTSPSLEGYVPKQEQQTNGSPMQKIYEVLRELQRGMF